MGGLGMGALGVGGLGGGLGAPVGGLGGGQSGQLALGGLILGTQKSERSYSKYYFQQMLEEL